MAEPRILAVKTHSLFRDAKFTSVVDAWRIDRPMRELAAQTGWKVDIVQKWLNKVETVADLDNWEAQAELKRVGTEYDIIYFSYQVEPWAYVVLQLIAEQYGTKFVMDIDDDVFNVSAYNPALKNLLAVEHNHFGVPLRNIDILRSIIEDCPHITTTTRPLMRQYRRLREEQVKDSIVVIPNMVSEKEHHHPGPKPTKTPKVIVGWYGSSHHMGDVENSGMLQAMERIMKEFKHVHFHVLGFVPDEKKYPKGRVKVFEPEVADWLNYWRKNMRFDIGLAPLEEHKFNDGKSNIKWQEYSMMGAATIASQSYPYRRSIKHTQTGLLTPNIEEEWYTRIKSLVEDADLRHKLARQAKEEVVAGSLERNVHRYRDYFLEIMEDRREGFGITV